jgi:hypothetical protein
MGWLKLASVVVWGFVKRSFRKWVLRKAEEICPHDHDGDGENPLDILKKDGDPPAE